jgi:dihydropteroate synthase|tara:strand:+ start:385 stop:924 length:540 start_codon:yes stop_codon:yes gene_type:complete
MAKLPFVVAPKIKTCKVRLGTEETGVVEIEKRGYLSVAEKSFVDSVLQQSDGVTQIVKLASTIARHRKISVETAYTQVVAAVSAEKKTKAQEEIAAEYADEINEIQSGMMESMSRKSIACTTILIQCRLNPDWTIEDTMTLQPELLAEFNRFYDSEEAKEDFEPAKVDSEKEAAEIVGK